MTKQELLTDLESKPDILHIVDRNPAPAATRGNVKWYDIPVVRSLGDDFVQGASQPIIVVDEGQAEEVAYYNGKKNFTEPQREQLYTDQQYINGVESNFTGWKVLDLKVRIDGDTDILTIRGSNGTNYTTQQIAVWNEGGNPKFKMVE